MSQKCSPLGKGVAKGLLFVCYGDWWRYGVDRTCSCDWIIHKCVLKAPRSAGWSRNGKRREVDYEWSASICTFVPGSTNVRGGLFE